MHAAHSTSPKIPGRREPAPGNCKDRHHNEVPMPSKPILIHRLTPAQIDLIDRLSACDSITMDVLAYPELVAHQELEKLGFSEMRLEPRKKIKIVITDQGRHVREAGYISKKPVVRLTERQVAALHFLAMRPRQYNDIPAQMKDVVRRLQLRGWAEVGVDAQGRFWTVLTADGWMLLSLLSY